MHLIRILTPLFAAYTVSASCLHGTSLLRREVKGDKVKVSEFGYTGLKGPVNWAALAPENLACATSTVQSPINLNGRIAIAPVPPRLTIESVEAAEFENIGTAVEVVINGTAVVGQREFLLRQFHFHTPSEHRIEEEYFPAEMHMVHEAADGSGAIVVISVLFELTVDGSTTQLIHNVSAAVKNIAEPGCITETGPLDFTQLIQHIEGTPLFQYTGSLTTPPCAEGLTFFVTHKPLPISADNFLALKSVVKFNSRFTQNNLGEANLLAVAAEHIFGVQNATLVQEQHHDKKRYGRVRKTQRTIRRPMN